MTCRAGDPVISPTHLPALRNNLRILLFGATGSLLHQFARYLVVGGLAFVIDFGALYLLTEFAGLYYLVSAAVAFLFGLVTNYCLSRVWVFNRRTMKNGVMEFVVFTVIGIVALEPKEVIIGFIREKITSIT